MGSHPTYQWLHSDDGPALLIRGATDTEIRQRLDAVLAEDGHRHHVPGHQRDSVRAGWVRANPCPPACGEHRVHYDPALPGRRGAFPGALIELVSERTSA
ncbi:hypothetical protein [Marinactinospora rubrisoli]|uniref:Uncharacterized protein n=1 Tax=Marinactinospora rubrisoli TaxID=2715399 RepID=A0ABW2KQA8_9ACTN